MVCLFRGDYGPTDPASNLGSGLNLTRVVDANSLNEARNLEEAEAIQRHLLRGEPISRCDQGYAWVDHHECQGLAIIFDILIGTSSSIFIASPILLFLGKKQLRPSQTRALQPTARTAAP
jgi:hypothetical protein